MVLRPCGGLADETAQGESPGYFRHRDIYTIAVVAVTAYAVYYYIGFIEGSYAILKDYYFFWQLNPYSLYGS